MEAPEARAAPAGPSARLRSSRLQAPAPSPHTPPSRTLPRMLSTRPGTRLPRGRDHCSGFSRLPGGAGEARLGDSRLLVRYPSLGGLGPPAPQDADQSGRGAGPQSSRPPSGLIESYIKKFSSERGEGGEGAEEQAERESEHARRKERLRLKHEGDHRLGICWVTVTQESSQKFSITPTLTFSPRS